MVEKKADFPRGQEPTNNIWEVIYTQRAIRYWQSKKVPRELLEQVIEAGSKAPSGSNLQPWIFLVIDEDHKRRAISAALREVFEASPAKLLVEAGENSEDRTQRLMLRGAREFFSKLEKAPALIIPCLYKLASPTQDPTSLLAGSSIYTAVQNIMLSARALGLGTVMTTAQGMIETTLRELLKIPDDAYPVAFIPIGFPEANFGPTTRKGLDEILCWNEWS
ncbi:MAG: nitroreductase family protein [Pseudomonadales bacterium]|nr:nitroreductase family protein [Pseudomonadales bacterium]